MSQLTYRPEIDGLRAISVIGVFLYHCKLGLTGGFVGVDVFFVISGFLITRILLKNLKNKQFSLTTFWSRRIRRILPASAATVFVTFIAGYFLLSPSEDFRALGDSIVWQSLIGANIYFWQDTGYFYKIAELKPLLHTWSLALEEQFYLLFPPTLALLYRYKKNWVLPATLGIAAISFLASCFGLVYFTSSTFFLLPARAWELLAGSLIAMIKPAKTSHTMRYEVTSWVGLVLIFSAMIFYTPGTPFPGWSALPPVLGAALFIHSNDGRSTRAGRLLSASWLVYIGLISYSLYLWHWPILAFAKHILIEITLFTRIFCFFASIVLAALSYKFIEQPFRKPRSVDKKKHTFLTAGAATLCLIILGLMASKGSILSRNIDAQTALILEDIDWKGMEFVSPQETPTKVGPNHHKTPRFIVWGDSYGMACSQLISEIAQENATPGELYLNPGRPPITGVWQKDMNATEAKEFVRQQESIFQQIIDSGASDLILIARWGFYLDGGTELDRSGKTHLDYENLVLTNESASSNSPQKAETLLKTSLHSMSNRLANHGIHLWIFCETPTTNTYDTAHRFHLNHRYPLLNHLPKFTTTREEYLNSSKKTSDLLRQLASESVTIIDPTDAFFSDNGRLSVYDKRSFFRDNCHLTRAGAEYYMRELFEPILFSISKKPKIPPNPTLPNAP